MRASEMTALAGLIVNLCPMCLRLWSMCMFMRLAHHHLTRMRLECTLPSCSTCICMYDFMSVFCFVDLTRVNLANFEEKRQAVEILISYVAKEKKSSRAVIANKRCESPNPVRVRAPYLSRHGTPRASSLSLKHPDLNEVSALTRVRNGVQTEIPRVPPLFWTCAQ